MLGKILGVHQRTLNSFTYNGAESQRPPVKILLICVCIELNSVCFFYYNISEKSPRCESLTWNHQKTDFFHHPLWNSGISQPTSGVWPGSHPEKRFRNGSSSSEASTRQPSLHRTSSSILYCFCKSCICDEVAFLSYSKLSLMFSSSDGDLTLWMKLIQCLKGSTHCPLSSFWSRHDLTRLHTAALWIVTSVSFSLQHTTPQIIFLHFCLCVSQINMRYGVLNS